MATKEPTDKLALDEGWLTGMDVPIGPWADEEIAFWSGTKRYQPWKDIAGFFREYADEE